MPIEYIVAILTIFSLTGMSDTSDVEEIFLQLLQLEEVRFIIGFQKQVQKEREKYWHDRHIMRKQLQRWDLVLLYDIFETFW